jgi:hypothetical protein
MALGVVTREAGTGQPCLDAAVVAAETARARTLVVPRPWQRIVAPLTGNCIGAGENLSGHHDAGPDPGTPKTTLAPAPAPSTASDSAKQLASLVMRTGRASMAARSRAIGWPLRHTEFDPRSKPVAREIDPGVPTPTVAAPRGRARSRSAASTSAATAASVPA